MRVLALASMVVAMWAAGLRADTLHWANPAGGSYHDPANWDPARVPVSGDNIVFDLDRSYAVSLDGAAINY